MSDHSDVRSPETITPTFNRAADPPDIRKRPEPQLNHNPPGPSGPSPGGSGGAGGQVSPQLREPPASPASDPKEAAKQRMKDHFNQQARNRQRADRDR
jgi:hypothetical protein